MAESRAVRLSILPQPRDARPPPDQAARAGNLLDFPAFGVSHPRPQHRLSVETRNPLPSSSTAAQRAVGAPTLAECMSASTRRYLADLNGTPCRDGLYARMLREIEAPLLREVLAWSDGNQSRAADVLGIHRATLRKKLRELGIA